jgi:hypothetical protein
MGAWIIGTLWFLIRHLKPNLDEKHMFIHFFAHINRTHDGKKTIA